jgi:hypothetical protein
MKTGRRIVKTLMNNHIELKRNFSFSGMATSRCVRLIGHRIGPSVPENLNPQCYNFASS